MLRVSDPSGTCVTDHRVGPWRRRRGGVQGLSSLVGCPVAQPRHRPLIELRSEEIESLVSPLHSGRASVERAEGGVINTVLRVVVVYDEPDRPDEPAGSGSALQLRIFNGEPGAFEKEHALLSLEPLRRILPVHEVLVADGSLAQIPYPFMVSRWIDGITLNECRKRVPKEEFLTLAEPLGALAAHVAQIEPPDVLRRKPSVRAPELIAEADSRLRAGLARERLGSSTAEALRRIFRERAQLLEPVGIAGALVHGDFLGRNILVEPADGAWRIVGLIDWELACCGWGLWDVGNLFRYARCYSPSFRSEFARGYCQAGGVLPADWYRTSRLLDATRSIALLTEERELPETFADCCEILAGVITDWESNP